MKFLYSALQFPQITTPLTLSGQRTSRHLSVTCQYGTGLVGPNNILEELSIPAMRDVWPVWFKS